MHAYPIFQNKLEFCWKSKVARIVAASTVRLFHRWEGWGRYARMGRRAIAWIGSRNNLGEAYYWLLNCFIVLLLFLDVDRVRRITLPPIWGIQLIHSLKFIWERDSHHKEITQTSFERPANSSIAINFGSCNRPLSQWRHFFWNSSRDITILDIMLILIPKACIALSNA